MTFSGTFMLTIACLIRITFTDDSLVFPYDECDSNFCYGFDSDGSNECIKDETCKIAVIAKIRNEEDNPFNSKLHFTLVLTNITISKVKSQWAAVGLSEDKYMGDDAVVDCYARGITEADIRNSMNFPGTKLNVYVNEKSVTGVELISVIYFEGTLQCMWKRAQYSYIVGQQLNPKTLAPFGAEHRKFVNLIDKQYNILLAYGNLRPGTVLTALHSPKNRGVSPHASRFDMLHSNCEQTFAPETTFCLGVQLNKEDERQKCVEQKMCDLLLMITYNGRGLNVILRIANVDSISPITKSDVGWYISVGFSIDKQIDNKLVTDCLNDFDSGPRITDSFYISTTSKVKEMSISYNRNIYQKEHILECKWRRRHSLYYGNIHFDTTKWPYFIFLAVGDLIKKENNIAKNKHIKYWWTLKPVVFPNFRNKPLFQECNADVKDTQCFGFRTTTESKDDCVVDLNCLFWMTIKRTEHGYRYRITGFVGNRIWIAAALSKDSKMGNDFVFECYAYEGFAKHSFSWNARDKTNKAAKVYGIKSTNVSLEEHKLTCEFSSGEMFTVKVENRDMFYDLRKNISYNILLAVGNLSKSANVFKKEKHIESVAAQNKFTSIPFRAIADSQTVAVIEKVNGKWHTRNQFNIIPSLVIGVFLIIVLMSILVMVFVVNKRRGE